MASRIPALPRDSHVQSHEAIYKNELCDSHAPLWPTFMNDRLGRVRQVTVLEIW
jgi:hypothetical protein